MLAEDVYKEMVNGEVEYVIWLLLVELYHRNGEEPEALHWAVWSTVTVTVTLRLSSCPLLSFPLLSFPLLSLNLPRLRSSILCSAAGGNAAASPKREETMMVERMATPTCDDSSGGKRSLNGFFLTAQFPDSAISCGGDDQIRDCC